MENNEQELQHDCVEKTDYISEIHYQNSVEYNVSFDKLYDEYKFLLDIDNYLDEIPNDTAERYLTFKKSVAEYYFLQYLREYQDLTLRGEVSDIIEGFQTECNLITQNNRILKDNIDYCTTFLAATRFINEFVAKGRKDTISKLSKQDIEIYLYLLHRENYFKVFPIPDKSFDVNSPSNPYSIIAEVYAHYFTFGSFIKRIHEKIYADKVGNRNNELQPIVNKYLRNSTEPAKSIFELIETQHKESFDKIIQTLSEDRPLHAVALTLKLSKKQRIDLFTTGNKLLKFQTKLICKVDKNRIYIDQSFVGINTFLAYLFAYMCKLNWINSDLPGSITAIWRAVVNTFYSNSPETMPIEISREQFNSLVRGLRTGSPKSQNNLHFDFVKMLFSSIE